jgi:hypothetical protein
LSDITGIETGSGYFIEERLEGVVVVTVHYEYFDRRVAEGTRDAEPAESGTDDEHARPMR